MIAGDPGTVWTGAAIDSRAVAGGELFFALAGERTDGHRFVEDAFERGAAAAVVHADEGAPRTAAAVGRCVIHVADSYRALHALARTVRRRVPEVLVGVTGSAGKTTTKELLAAVASRRFRTARNPGNFNNLYGFPLSLLNVPDDCEVMVAELGMSVAGELGEVSRLARPDGVVLTNVRPVHLENFADVPAIAEAKAEIFEGLGRHGFIVANRDDPEVARVTRRRIAAAGGRAIWFGMGEAPEIAVRARDLRPAAIASEVARGAGGIGGTGGMGTRFVLEVRDGGALADAAGGEAGEVESVEIELPLHGRYNVMNALAAAAAGRALGVELDEIRAGLALARPATHRGAIHRLEAGVVVIDDSYNSNPEALAEALASAKDLQEAGAVAAGTGGRRVAIVGDMLELGPDAPRFHRESGRRAAELGFSPVVAVGELAVDLARGAAEGGAEALHLPDAAAAAAWARTEIAAGDLVLVKGSRGIGLDRVVDELLAQRDGKRKGGLN